MTTTLRDIRESAFDIPFPTTLPPVTDLPFSEYRRLKMKDGSVYQLHRKTLPDGSVVKEAAQYNGFRAIGKSVSESMRYGQAWTPVLVLTYTGATL